MWITTTPYKIQAADLAQETEIKCAVFAFNAASAMEMLGRDDDQIKYLGMQNRYMAQAEEKYGKGMGVSPRTMKSALNRAKDAELEKFLAAIEEMKTRGADDKKAVPEYFSIRQLSLDCQ